LIRTLHPKTKGYTFFSSVHETFYRIGHLLGYKIGHNEFKRIEIIQNIFLDYHGMKLEISNRNLEIHK